MPSTYEALAVLVLFFVPGYIAAQVYVRNDPTADDSQPKYLMWIAFWSVIAHALALQETLTLVPRLRALDIESGVFLRWFIVYLMLIPTALGFAAGFLVRTRL